jgi:uncharacterized protein involved in exopolysaccharide biosynthesis
MIRLILLRVLESYFRHRFAYLIPIALMAGVAAFSIATATPSYRAFGTVFVQGESLVSALSPNPLPGEGGDWWSTSSGIFADQVSELLRTESFVRSMVAGTPLEAQMNASEAGRTEVIQEVNRSAWVITIGDNLVRFGADHENPELALQLSNRLIESFIAWKLNSDRQEGAAAQRFFSELQQPYQAELDQARANLQRFIDEHPLPVRGPRPETEAMELARLQAEVADMEERVAEIERNEESARLSQIQAEQEIRQAYILIDSPRLPTRPRAGLRDLVIDNAIFVAVGVVLAIMGILGGAVLDRSVRFPIDAHQLLHLPVVAQVPQTKPVPVPTEQTQPAEQSQPESTETESRPAVQPQLTGALSQNVQE